MTANSDIDIEALLTDLFATPRGKGLSKMLLERGKEFTELLHIIDERLTALEDRHDDRET